MYNLYSVYKYKILSICRSIVPRFMFYVIHFLLHANPTTFWRSRWLLQLCWKMQRVQLDRQCALWYENSRAAHSTFFIIVSPSWARPHTSSSVQYHTMSAFRTLSFRGSWAFLTVSMTESTAQLMRSYVGSGWTRSPTGVVDFPTKQLMV